MTAAGRRGALRALTAIFHVLLLAAMTAWFLSLPQARPIIWLAAPIAPLLLALRGLYLDRARTYQWLSLVLVLYAGIGTVEVIASQRAATSAAVVMLSALAELLLLMSLVRNAPPEPRV